MERDYTTEVEEMLGLVQSDIQSDNYHFLTTTSGTETSGIYSSWSTYNSSDTSHYTGLFSSVGRCFEAVRNYDAIYNGKESVYFGNIDKTLETFKKTINGIRDCMNVPSCEVGPLDSIFYKDTIFGDEYADLVVSEGFEELMLKSDSATATKYFFDQIITVNADGSVEYNMTLILEIMEKSGDDIHPGQYDAIALAYTYMTEDEMAQLMCACTNKVEDVKYGDNPGSAIGIINEDYSSWERDQEKYNNIYGRLVNVSDGYLNVSYELKMAYEYADTPEDKKYYEELLTECENTRKNIIQRMALWGAFGGIDEYRGDFQGDMPTINIESKNYDVGNRESYVLTYFEYRNIGSPYAPVISTLGDSTIIIHPCLEELEISDYYTDRAEENIVNQFACGFTSEGYEDGLGKYIFENILGLAEGTVSNYYFNNIPPVGGYINIIGQSIIGGFVNYQAGVEGATVIEETFNGLDVSNMYAHMGFYVVPIISDTSEGQTNIQYVQPGTNSAECVESFNEKSETKLSLSEIIYHPQTSANIVDEHYGDGKLKEK